MLSPERVPARARRTLDMLVAHTAVRLEAPEPVLAVLDATLSHVPRITLDGPADVTISVVANDDVFEIYGLAGSVKVLGAHSALPQIAGAVVTSIVTDVAAHRSIKTMRASVIEREGRGFALVGDDWESAITLAAHLHGRGWHLVGSDHVLIDPDDLRVYPLQKSLYVNSSAVAEFPIEYRRAVEASPWYVTPNGISFYAVDPRRAGYQHTWATTTTLAGVVVIDGTMLDRPALESVPSPTLLGERFARFGIDWSRVGIMDLRIGDYVETCDLLEHWFESVAAEN